MAVQVEDIGGWPIFKRDTRTYRLAKQTAAGLGRLGDHERERCFDCLQSRADGRRVVRRDWTVEWHPTPSVFKGRAWYDVPWRVRRGTLFCDRCWSAREAIVRSGDPERAVTHRWPPRPAQRAIFDGQRCVNADEIEWADEADCPVCLDACERITTIQAGPAEGLPVYRCERCGPWDPGVER